MSSPAAADGGSVSPKSPGGENKSFDATLFDQVELVYQRVTKGRHDLKRFKAYVEARAAMSVVWTKAGKKAAEQPELEDSSSIGAVWQNIKDAAKAQIVNQEQFVVICGEIAVALEEQIKTVKSTKTALHAAWTKSEADVKKKQQLHDKAKLVYYESVKQAETAVVNRDNSKSQNVPEKQFQKVEARAKQCLKEVDTLHAAYEKAVNTLKEAQQSYDATVADCLRQFESLERKRMTIFLEQTDRFAGAHDTYQLTIDGVAKAMHSAVNAVNIPADIQSFIRANAKGLPMPAHVEYQPCRSQIIDHANDGKGSVPIAAAAFTSSPKESPHVAAGVSPNAAAAAASVASPIASVVASPVAHSAAGVELATALFDFDQNEPDDLPFKVGDTIRLLSAPDGEDWWQGEKDGRTGIFPKEYVKKNSAIAAAGGAPGGATVPATEAPYQGEPSPPAVKASNPFGAEGGGWGEGATAATATQAAVPGAAAPAAEVPKLLDARCAALFDFDGQDEDELSFKVGQMLIITVNGWFLGKVEGSEKVGIFPSNYVNLVK